MKSSIESTPGNHVQSLGELRAECGAAMLSVERRKEKSPAVAWLRIARDLRHARPVRRIPRRSPPSKYFRFARPHHRLRVHERPAATTPGCLRTVASAFCQSFITMSSPNGRTRTSGLPMRIFSRRSFCNPFITPMMTINALTATATPPIEIRLISESSFDPRRLRRYREASQSSRRLSFRAQRGKQDDVADVRRVGEIHEQPVDPDPYPAHRRHAVFHRPEIILVDARRFLVAGGAKPSLRLEPTALIDRIVELAERIRELRPRANSSNRSVERGFPRFGLASGDSSTG